MTNEARTARAIADVSSGTILAQVEIAAPIERVFAALTRGDEIVKWWGSDELYRTTAWESELRPGGSWKARGVGSDGLAFTIEGQYVVVDPPRLVAFTWKPDWDPATTSTVSYRLEEIESGTRVVLRHEGLTDPGSCRNHSIGWERVLGWLTGHLIAPQAVHYVMCRLVPPRPDFPMTMSPIEREVMGRHSAYCKSLINRGKALLFGPVADTTGVWGCGVLMVKDDAEARMIVNADPAVTGGIGARYELMPFLGMVR